MAVAQGPPGRRRDASRPNLVMGANVQVCWEKFCRYWEVEPRMVPMEQGRLHLTADGAVAQCDENTIGVVAILGSTMDGSYEPVKEISGALDELQRTRGYDVPVHVDGASGGFVAPFLQPFLEWDFRVPGSRPSTPPGTSTAWCTRGWAGWCGGSRRAAPGPHLQRRTTWAGRCRRSR